MESSFVPPDVIAERFERLKTVVDRSALARHQARVGRSEEALVEGVSRRDDSMLTGRTRQGKLIHFPAGTTAGTPAPGALARVTVTDGHPAPPVRPPGGGDGAAPASRAHPGGERLTAVALVGVTASGKSETALELAPAPGRLRDRLGRFHVRLPRHGHRDLEAGPRGTGGRAAPSPRPGRPGRGLHRHPIPAGRPGGVDVIAARGHHALLVGGTGLYLRAVVDDLAIPARYPEVAAALEAELDEGRAGPADLHARLAALDPVGGGADGADQPPAGRPRPGGHPRFGAPLLDVRSRARGLPGRRHGTGGPLPPARRGRPPDRRPVRAHGRGRPGRRGAGAGRPARRHVADGAPGARLPRDPGPPGGRRTPGRLPGGGGPAHPPVRPAPGLVVPPRPPGDAGPRSSAEAQALLERALVVHG